ncbi:MAG: VIT1/CCC1 transporter family protein [Acidobacteriota bacterium]|nr:VIT1/CCC1 transporter family protein [Acidobacteriota bacterium]
MSDSTGSLTSTSPPETHRGHRAAWLRAAVLGADDGIVSTSSLMLGVAASGAARSAILTAGLAGLAAGAMAMAAGEYVSVASQRDSEQADLARERAELAASPGAELEELTRLYVHRGVEAGLARQVAEQLTSHDALSAHARDELGLSEERAARPLQAAVASALAFSIGAVAPIVALAASPRSLQSLLVAVVAVIGLALLGWAGASAGGARWPRPTYRVVLGGSLAMAVTMGVGLATHTAAG